MMRKANRKTNKNNAIQSVAEAAVFLLLLAVCLAGASRLLERKESQERLGEFFSADAKAESGNQGEGRDLASAVKSGKDADVLLLGSSHMINGINPALLYEKYGIAAYNLGGHGNVLPVTYWELVNALDYSTPQYVVVDTYLLDRDYHYLDVQTPETSEEDRNSAVGQLHAVLDAFPMTGNKRAAIQDLIGMTENRPEFYWDFIRYHSRWSSLAEEDYDGWFGETSGPSILGGEMQYETDADVIWYDRIDPSEKMSDETVGKVYLRKILDLCREREITAILVQIPFAENEDLQAIGNSAQGIAEEYGVPYINMNYVENLIDPYTDQQSQTHLNALGAAKTTTWLGKVLSETVGVPDRHGADGYELWDNAVRRNHEQIREHAVDPEDLYAELMTLNFDDVSSILFINNDSVAFYDPSLRRLIENISGTNGIETMAGTGLGYCLIHDPATGTRIETKEGIPLTNVDTSFGRVNFTSLEKYNLLTVGDDTEDNQLDYVNQGDVDVQILLYDPATGEQIGHLFFRNGGLVRG